MPRKDLIKPRQGSASAWAAAEASAAQTSAGELVAVGNDLVIADGVTKVASLPKVGSGTYVPFYGSVTGFLGDSITSANGSNATNQAADTHSTYAVWLSGGRIIWGGAWGPAGYTAEQVESEYLPLVLAQSPKLARCVVLAGTNNVGSGGFDLAATLATLTRIYTKLRQNGIQPVACTIPPRGDSTSANQKADSLNVGIRILAQRMGITLLDYHSVLVDPATGVYRSGYCIADNLHPSYLGHKVMGAYAAPILAALAPDVRVALLDRAGSTLDSTDLLGGKGLFLVDTNADGLADGYDYVSAAGSTWSITTDGDGTKWQRLTVPSTAGVDPLARFATAAATVAVGDVLEVVGRVRTSGFDAGALVSGGAVWGFSMELPATATAYSSPAYSLHCDVADGRFAMRGTVPAGANGVVRVNFSAVRPASGSRWIEYTGVTVRNLTALGLASL